MKRVFLCPGALFVSYSLVLTTRNQANSRVVCRGGDQPCGANDCQDVPILSLCAALACQLAALARSVPTALCLRVEHESPSELSDAPGGDMDTLQAA